MQVFSTRSYERAVRKLLGQEARKEMEDAIVAAPDAAPVIRGTGGIRKLRWAGSGRGKRGGIRTVYFYHAGPEAVYLLTAYAKANRKDLTPADTRALSRLVAEIKKEATGQ
ncbi:MAG: type II toxin-antitoxin system RelE/ParE family toxin [Paracoccaceae bacterium]|nr:type II toxin-antitoxin system RelE/ParE family toxin [Paracoccaceae bacterium]MDE2911895.1 type II toxin-antitoxin system RelE/ParE family toxin [Paracoccaceae bacterium]